MESFRAAAWKMHREGHRAQAVSSGLQEQLESHHCVILCNCCCFWWEAGRDSTAGRDKGCQTASAPGQTSETVQFLFGGGGLKQRRFHPWRSHRRPHPWQGMCQQPRGKKRLDREFFLPAKAAERAKPCWCCFVAR